MPPNTLAELRREMARLRRLAEQIREIEAARPQRQAAGVTSIKNLAQTQCIFRRYEVRPTFVLDYPEC